MITNLGLLVPGSQREPTILDWDDGAEMARNPFVVQL